MIKDLPKKLKELRIRYGYSQKQVASKLGVSPSKTGERTPSTDALLALSYLFHCSTDYLSGKQTVEPRQSISVEGLSANQIKALLSLIESIREER